MATKILPFVFAAWILWIVFQDKEKRDLHPLTPVILKMIDVESSGNPKAVSPRGAKGLMQIMPETAKAFKVKDPFDPKENVDAGIRLFLEEMERFGNIKLALAAYNCGSSKVRKAMSYASSNRYEDVKPYLPKETQRYVEKVMS